MKKLTIMAACAALLLGGGVFLKTFNANIVLSSNIEALAISEEDILYYLAICQESDNQFNNHAPTTENCTVIVFDFGWGGSVVTVENSSLYNQIIREGKFKNKYAKTERKIVCITPGGGCTEHACDDFVQRW